MLFGKKNVELGFYKCDKNESMIDFCKYLNTRVNNEYFIVSKNIDTTRLENDNPECRVIKIDDSSCKKIIASLREISKNIIRNSIVLLYDMNIEKPKISKVLKIVKKYCSDAMFLIISELDSNRVLNSFNDCEGAEGVRLFNKIEFRELIKKNFGGEGMFGNIPNQGDNNAKTRMLYIYGRFMINRKQKYDNKSVLAIINLYNEEDVIEQVIRNLINEGVDIHIVDNWSTDKSYEIVEKLKVEFKDNIVSERFPEKPSEYYEWGKLLDNVTKIAKSSKHDWILHHDADEIRKSPWCGVKIREAISFIDSIGFNAIDFTVIDFRPTINSKQSMTNNDLNQISSFEFGNRPGHFLQVKGWRNMVGVDVNLSDTGGHIAQFEGNKVYPIKFLNKHYPLRNQEQAAKKIFKERNGRVSPIEKNEKGWHTHYDHFKVGDLFEWPEKGLIIWSEQIFNSEYLIERISGINIK